MSSISYVIFRICERIDCATKRRKKNSSKEFLGTFYTADTFISLILHSHITLYLHFEHFVKIHRVHTLRTSTYFLLFLSIISTAFIYLSRRRFLIGRRLSLRL